ncbi:proteoglycan 4-like [Mytilus californianus]|uniref:proteoglycan 4-like n=1 Tax=Mytilus californianus TaxID=6549 RepID=UPI00224677A1|nr:proteoglycan 4-like [Mytilus californianus]
MRTQHIFTERNMIMLLVILYCQIVFLVQSVSSADTTPISPANTTQIPPAADTTQISPANTTQITSANTTQISTANTTQVAPAETTQKSPANTTQKSPTNTTQKAPANTTQKAPANKTDTEYAILKKLFRKSRDVPIVDQESYDAPMIEDEENQDSGYGPWGQWTKCAKHCGIGRSTRERKCNDLDNCHDGNIEVRLCSKRDCKPSG